MPPYPKSGPLHSGKPAPARPNALLNSTHGRKPAGVTGINAIASGGSMTSGRKKAEKIVYSDNCTTGCYLFVCTVKRCYKKCAKLRHADGSINHINCKPIN